MTNILWILNVLNTVPNFVDRFEAGCPSSGVLHSIKKSSKSRFKCEVRRLKLREHHPWNEKLIAALAANKNKDLSAYILTTTLPLTSMVCLMTKTLQTCLLISLQRPWTSVLKLIVHCPPHLTVPQLIYSSIALLPSVSEAFKHLKRNKSHGSELDSSHLIFVSEAISESLSSLFPLC